LVKLLKEMKNAPAASTGAVNSTVVEKSDAHTAACHGESEAEIAANM
jgi:hypothetical protein